MLLFLRYFIFIFSILAVSIASDSRSLITPVLGGQYQTAIKHSEIQTQTSDPFIQGKKRKIGFSIFYPTSETKNCDKVRLVDFFPMGKEFEFRYKSFFQNNDWYHSFSELYSQIELQSCKTGVIKNLKSFPIIIFSPGAGGGREGYVTLLEQLSSYGNIVFALDHPHWGGGNNTVFYPKSQEFDVFERPNKLFEELQKKQEGADPYFVKVRTKDVSDVIDYLPTILVEENLISSADTHQIIIAGHSFGGATAFYSTQINQPNVVAYIDFDGTFNNTPQYTKRVEQPILLILTTQGAKEEAQNYNMSFDEYEEFNYYKGLDLDLFMNLTILRYQDYVHSDFSIFGFMSTYGDFLNERAIRSLPIKHSHKEFLDEISQSIDSFIKEISSQD